MDPARAIDFDLKVGRTFFEAQRIGPIRVQGSIQNQIMQLDALHLSNFENADIRLNGALNYDAAPSYGALSLSVESDTAQWLRVPVLTASRRLISMAMWPAKLPFPSI